MIFTIAGKELRALFASPLAWVVLTFVQLILTVGFLRRIDEFLQIQPQLVQMPNAPGVTAMVAAPVYATLALVMLFAVPLLAMRLIAEERRNQTMVFLISAPLTMTEIVLGKFVGLSAFLLLIVGMTTLMPLSLLLGGRLDFGLLLSLLVGITLLAMGFAAISLYASALTAQPLVAAMIAFGLLLALLLLGEAVTDSLHTRRWQIAAAAAQIVSPLKNFEPFARGVIDTYAIVCSLLLIATFLVLTIRRLDAMRLRG
jgi:ABC-2 type transport system permease protein